MFGNKKNKKNKFHLPIADPKQDPTHKANGPLYSAGMSPEIYDDEGLVEGSDNCSIATSSTIKHQFIVASGQLTEKKPTRNWAIYYRDRNHAGDVGDPLLSVVEASSREEAESKAKMGEGHENTGIMAVNMNNLIVHPEKKSDFSFPTSKAIVSQPYPRVFRYTR